MRRFLSLLLLLPGLAFGQMAGGLMESQRQGHADITSGTITGITDLAVADGGTGASTARGAAANLLAPHVLCRQTAAVSGAADTVENVLHTCTVPANAMGPNGFLRITSTWTWTNGADDKIPRIRFSGAAGTIFWAITATTTATVTHQQIIVNRNATNSQIGMMGSGTSNPFTAHVGGLQAGAIDTLPETTVVLTCQKETGANACTLEAVLIELMHGA